jgi:ribonuclease R
MNFSIATLLSHFSDDKFLTSKILEKKLGCEDTESIHQLGIALEVLGRIGVLEKDKGKFRRLAEEDVIEAKLRCSSKGFCFAIQDQFGAEDIYVRESHLGNAWNGDRALIKVMKEGTRRRSPEGIVKLILERANPSLLARLKQPSPGKFQAVPLDDRLLCELEISPNGTDLSGLDENLVQVEVLRHQIGQEPAIGQVLRVLGTSAEDAAETDIVCCKHDLSPQFPEKVTAAAERLPLKVSPKMAKGRKDFTALTTFALAEEIGRWENAFSLETNSDGSWLVVVHIADVASYLEPDEYLDREARRRGAAVYLGEVFVPLVPPAVQLACALTSTTQRMAISVALSVNASGEVQNFEIHRSLVRVDHHLTYGQIEEAIAGKMKGLSKVVANKIKDFVHQVAPALRQQRQQRGGLEVSLLECQTRFADEGRLGVVFADHIQAAITEVAVAANQAIASHLQALGVPALYSIQYQPENMEINDLRKLVQNLGLLPEPSAEGEEAPEADLAQISQTFAQSSAARVLNHILKSMLKPSMYSAEPGAHFGLSLTTGYLQAVSPLSRYGDILNQRVLHAVLDGGRDRKSTRSKEVVDLHSSSCHGQISWNVLTPSIQQELATQINGAISHLNDRQKVGQDAENDLQGLQKAEQMKSRIGQVFQGLIVGVQSYGFFVEIEDFLVEGLVHVSSLKDDWYEFRPRYACLVGRKNRITYRLGDRVEVEVKNVDYYRQQIDLVTVASTLAAEETATEFEEI